MTPNPTQMLRTCRDTQEVERIRFLDCSNYSGCVDSAAAAAWQGFHCSLCPLRAAHVRTPEDLPPDPEPLPTARYRNVGVAPEVRAAFATADTWNVAGLVKRTGYDHTQIRDACRELVRQDFLRRLAPGLFERCE